MEPTPVPVPVTVADALSSLEHAVRQERAAQVAQALSILAVCDLYQVDETNVFDGAETWIQGGADGTPYIGEFVAGEIGALLGVSPASAACRIATVLNLRHRHPHLWGAVLAGQVAYWAACQVADQCATAGLSMAACAHVDHHCAIALQFQPWNRVRTQIDRWILQADTHAAAERAARAALSRTIVVAPIVDGHCDLWGRLDAADGLALEEALTVVATTLPTDTSLDHRRATALGIIARHTLGQHPLPTGDPTHTDTNDAERNRQTPTPGGGPTKEAADRQATEPTPTRGRGLRNAELVLHLDGTNFDHDTAVVRIERWGSLLANQLPDVLAGRKIIIRPILNPHEIAPVDAYQVPEQMRFALAQRNPVDVFPYATRTARACDTDHTIPYDHTNPTGGQTHLANLGPLSRRTHRMKTFGGWRMSQPEPGVYHWQSPAGYEYTVTAQGTIMTKRPTHNHEWWHQEPPEPDIPEFTHHREPDEIGGDPGRRRRPGRQYAQRARDSFDTDDGPPPDNGHAQPALVFAHASQPNPPPSHASPWWPTRRQSLTAGAG